MTEIITKKVLANEGDLNRDPLSGESGSHPLGAATGATSGGAAGAVIGLAAGGPIGALVGVAVGAVAGGLAGKSAAEAVNPTDEEAYWRQTYIREPYYVSGRPYEYYAPGYRVGWEARGRDGKKSFDEAEADMMLAYNQSRRDLDPGWSELRPVVRAGWDHAASAGI